MANMGHCRFQNTYRDLRDCNDHLEDFDNDERSDDERKAAIRLVGLCQRIAENWGYITEEGESDGK